ncbi:hypothetical protein SAMN05216226_1307 [Halovenus aranensis]|uniref:Uncharacterized protein n=2 Tax=Halovenus aranensis TaxID=890420 RepID=A0A1G8ZQU9_9EURY|nr:hypothetical protein SAMN05216226_1307 [Halovenus aranensis]
MAELTHACEAVSKSTEDLEDELDVSHRRARETILEAKRISLLDEDDSGEEPVYTTTDVGRSFLSAIRDADWGQVSTILETRSPHYGAFIEVLEDVENAGLDTLLTQLEETQEFSPYSYNQTSVEVLGDWAERLGRVQRNAFTGEYYLADQAAISANFHYLLLDVYDDLEERAGVDLRQRYLSIPRLREETCERLGCTRDNFDGALLALCRQNVGKLELSGAPMDTAAKDAALGIKRIALSEEDGLVSTSQSTQQVMAGVEQFGKKYYYLAVHDRDIEYSQEAT